MTVKIALLTDFHYDALYDGNERLHKVIEELQNKDIDVILNLGDLCPPISKYKKVIIKFTEANTKVLYTLGNHDVEHHNKSTLLDFYEIDNDYYSFEYKHTKFIILNSNYMKVDGEYNIYNRDVFKAKGGLYPVIDPRQLEWLKEELKTDCKNIVIASHHSLENDFSNRGVINRVEVRQLLETVRKDKNLIVSFNGHDHSESSIIINDIHYLGMNSMSYIWLGDNVKPHKYLEPYYNKYPGLNFILLYKESLFSYITFKESGEFRVEGRSTTYLTDTPIDIGINNIWNGRKLQPSITTKTYNQKGH